MDSIRVFEEAQQKQRKLPVVRLPASGPPFKVAFEILAQDSVGVSYFVNLATKKCVSQSVL